MIQDYTRVASTIDASETQKTRPYESRNENHVQPEAGVTYRKVMNENCGKLNALQMVNFSPNIMQRSWQNDARCGKMTREACNKRIINVRSDGFITKDTLLNIRHIGNSSSKSSRKRRSRET